MLAALFDAYRADPARLPPEWRPARGDEIARDRAIGDFIAGMTDRYAIARYREAGGSPIEGMAEQFE
jgi:dGTPase